VMASHWRVSRQQPRISGKRDRFVSDATLFNIPPNSPT
jgi:hypothetical protein